MKKIKILQMPIRNANGGITQYAIRNWEHIDKNRFCFDWITLDKELDFANILIQQGCNVHYLSCRQEDDETQFRVEMENILSKGYDAIHLHTSYWRGFLAEELAIKAEIPKIIVHAHSTGVDVNDMAERKKLLEAHNKWKARFNAELATHFAACSISAARFLFGQQIPTEKIITLKNAIKTSRYAYNPKVRKDIRLKMGLNDKYVIIQTARMEYQKNHEFTLRVFTKALEVLPNAVLLLAGDGKLRRQLENQASELQITDKVHFLGFRHDIPDLLQVADLLVLPSLFEGFGIAAIEAQCSGIWCLLSNNIPEETLVTDNTVRLPLDYEEWVNEIINQSKLKIRNEHAVEQLCKAGWDLSQQIKIIEEMYT